MGFSDRSVRGICFVNKLGINLLRACYGKTKLFNYVGLSQESALVEIVAALLMAADDRYPHPISVQNLCQFAWKTITLPNANTYLCHTPVSCPAYNWLQKDSFKPACSRSLKKIDNVLYRFAVLSYSASELGYRGGRERVTAFFEYRGCRVSDSAAMAESG